MLTDSQLLILERTLDSEFYFSPYKFALWAYGWGENDLKQFDGPRQWQKDVMLEMETYLRQGVSMQRTLGLVDDYYRHAVASGRGPGKSALVGMLAHWFLSTRIGGSVWVAANGKPQLETKTFPEIAKWVARGINKDFFEINSTTIRPSKWFAEHIESPEGLNKNTKYYYVSGQLWSKENPDAFAGAHNWDGEFAIFDEASGIPDEIWPVQEGVFTEKIVDRFWLAFSNPRVSQGAFFECFHKNRNLWRTTQVDSRTVEGIDHSAFNNIIAQYGEDSDEARVEVYGQFPKSGEDQFISPFMVDEALKRQPYEDASAPLIIGVDPARSGLDSTVIAIRKGRDLVKLLRYKGEDTMQIVGRVIDVIEEFQPDMTVIDEGGVGAGVLDRLQEQRYKVRGVNFGWKSSNPTAYLNTRSEIWWKMKEWLKTASLAGLKHDEAQLLKQDLCSPNKKPTSSGTLQLEGKREMKARGMASPDCFVAGTMVTTPNGLVPIETVQVGDFVTTPFGKSKVVMVHCVKATETTTVRFSNGQSLTGKGAHRVFTYDNGWVRLDALSVTNEIETDSIIRRLPWILLNLSSTRVKSSIFKHQVDTINPGGRQYRRGFFTDVFGLTTLALYLMDSMFITRMVTGLTTHRQILSASVAANISQGTCLNSCQTKTSGRMRYQHLTALRMLQKSGMDQRRGLNGTQSMANGHGIVGNQLMRLAYGAGKLTRLISKVGHHFALLLVHLAKNIEKTRLLQQTVSDVVRSLCSISTASKHVAPVAVQANTGQSVLTYNLTLENDNVYYANGILVENCADAIAVSLYYNVASSQSAKPMREKLRDRNSRGMLSVTSSQGGWMN